MSPPDSLARRRRTRCAATRSATSVRGDRSANHGAAQAAPKPESGRGRVELSGARKEAGDLRDIAPLRKGLEREGHPARRDVGRPRRLSELSQDQHLQLVQDCQDLVQAEAVLYPAAQRAHRELRHAPRFQLGVVQVVQEPVEVGRGAPQLLPAAQSQGAATTNVYADEPRLKVPVQRQDRVSRVQVQSRREQGELQITVADDPEQKDVAAEHGVRRRQEGREATTSPQVGDAIHF